MNATARAGLVDGGESPAVRVRGLRAAGSTPAHLCLHCGVPLATAAARADGFCCAGCAYVYRLVHEHGLEGYYKIKDAVLPPVDQGVFQPRDYGWVRELQAEAEKSPGTPEMVVEVQGISCAGCVWLIERVFHQQPGALYVETDAQLGRMNFRWTRGAFDAAAFGRTLQSFNYLIGLPGEEPERLESKRLARRLGLCAAFAMNIMLFALPAYFGMESTFPYARLFGTLSLIFGTLSLLVGGSYFIGRAIQALRAGAMHIDLPIALGIIGAYGGSFYGWASGQPSFVYFDFVGTFILLMLIGRWAQIVAVERNRHRLLSMNARPQRVGVVGADGTVAVRPIEQLRDGDLFEVRAGEVVPVEAQLETPAATVGTAWITGEADPRDCRAGARVPAGAVNLGRAAIRLRAVQPWAGSLLAQLFRPAGRDQFRHRLLERVVRGYLVGILVVAAATALGWWWGTHEVARTWAAVTAVLVVSCPCAIGLAYPLADEMATVTLRRFGVFVREGDLWPRLGRIRNLIFDKTGTLTLETPALQNPAALAALAPPARAALLVLVRDSAHPVSQSLYENLLAAHPTAGFDAAAGTITEAPGFGVTLQNEAGRWSLGRPGWAGGAPDARHIIDDKRSGGHDTEFALEGVVLARFRFADAVRADAREEIAALGRAGLTSYILSGDRRDKVVAMAQALGLPEAQAAAEVTPEEKASWVRRIDARDTLMLGDGANDSLAFDAAFARGTPVIHRGVLEGKADFYYLGRGLAGLRRLFEVNATRARTQAVLIGFSICYNLVTVSFAALGHMSPLIAAIIMPASSLLSLLVVAVGMRRWLRMVR